MSLLTKVECQPLEAPLGAEILRLDLREGIQDPDEIIDYWHRWQVLVFRGQTLTPEQQVAATRILGTPGRPNMPARAVREVISDLPPEIMIVSNVRIDGKPLGLPHDGEMWFHSDMCYVARPHTATLLYAVDLPSTGGNTLFANMYAAYDNLADATRRRLESKKALHIHDYKRTARPSADVDLETVANHAHPVFVTHPGTGRRALYVNRLMTARIEGVPEKESDELLEELFAVSEDPSIVYEHVWQPGDLVMWDNRCVNHARTDYPANERRLLRRTTIVGTEKPG